MLKITVFFVLFLISGCASQQDKTPEQLAAERMARKQCSQEAPTGSLRKRSRCRSASQIKAEREAAQEALRNRTSSSVGSGPSQ